ncbi:MAG: gamma-glutamyl-gamma-aminobutyrate hydrolase family protein [[Clostridium] nexile]
MKSKIGIVICGLMGEKQFVSDAYIKAVKSAGGLPIILPLVKSNEVITDYAILQRFCLWGR